MPVSDDLTTAFSERHADGQDVCAALFGMCVSLRQPSWNVNPKAMALQNRSRLGYDSVAEHELVVSEAWASNPSTSNNNVDNGRNKARHLWEAMRPCQLLPREQDRPLYKAPENLLTLPPLVPHEGSQCHF